MAIWGLGLLLRGDYVMILPLPQLAADMAGAWIGWLTVWCMILTSACSVKTLVVWKR